VVIVVLNYETEYVEEEEEASPYMAKSCSRQSTETK
jgi:hypothetical protein